MWSWKSRQERRKIFCSTCKPIFIKAANNFCNGRCRKIFWTSHPEYCDQGIELRLQRNVKPIYPLCDIFIFLSASFLTTMLSSLRTWRSSTPQIHLPSQMWLIRLIKTMFLYRSARQMITPSFQKYAPWANVYNTILVLMMFQLFIINLPQVEKRQFQDTQRSQRRTHLQVLCV